MLWAIGDIQGCLDPLRRLLAQLPADARLVFVGDLINRGPQSLQTLRFVRDLGERAVTVLGNHDLHLLAAAAGIRPLHADDTLADILTAPDRDALIDWLRFRPLAHREAGALFVHAGVLPQWSADQALALAAEVESGLRAADWQKFIATMYGNLPARWSDLLSGAARSRCIINAMTRLRFIAADGTMDFKVKGGGDAAPAGLMPWFDHPGRATRGVPIIIGHWSALGLVLRDDLIALDTGCVWGGSLTALHWPDRELRQVTCSGHAEKASAD